MGGMGGMPGMPQEQPKPKADPNKVPKLMDPQSQKNKGMRLIASAVNAVYAVFFITRKFSKNILWVGSCFGLMFLFPMMLEYTAE